MATLADFLTALTPVLQTVTGVTTVLTGVPTQPITEEQTPAIWPQVMDGTVINHKTRTRSVEWAIQIWINVGVRTETITTDIAQIQPFPERVMAALDTAGNFNGILATTLDYAEPAVIHPGTGEAFGLTQWGQFHYVETAVHCIVRIDRVGGFGPNG
jgi:hypothetical protein